MHGKFVRMKEKKERGLNKNPAAGAAVISKIPGGKIFTFLLPPHGV